MKPHTVLIPVLLALLCWGAATPAAGASSLEAAGVGALVLTVAEEPLATAAPVGTEEPPVTAAPVEAEEPLMTAAPVGAEEPLMTTAPVGAEEPLMTTAPVGTADGRATENSGGESPATAYVISNHRCGKEGCYWETPMDISNTQAVWKMLTAPITVLAGSQREQEFVYAQPSKESQKVAEVTCASQGVHVLETREDGWSKIQCYSSSFHGSKVKAWNALVEGYVPTELLTEQPVQPRFGLVVDKLTQRLYVFENGELLDTLAVSTGKPNASQPYNETRSGEFLLVSRVGGFPSGNLICAMGIRFNNGDILHEVPHVINEQGKKYYGSRETHLGSRASHGCIRVQRKRTPLGLNMAWLWKNLYDQLGTRLVIWEDAPGRAIPLPAEDTPLYCNLKVSKYYHRSPTCYQEAEKKQPDQAFLYRELEDKAYRSLQVCPSCYPPLRLADIQAINEAHQ